MQGQWNPVWTAAPIAPHLSSGLLHRRALHEIYGDSLRRLTETDFPDGGYTKTCYTDAGGAICSQGSYPYKVTTRKAINGSAYAETTVVMNGMGRTTQTQLTSDPQGAVLVDTTYDGMGRVWKQSNPYRSGTDATSSPGTTTFAYDALGRKLTATAPDNSVINTSYCGPSTLVKDPTNRWRRSRTNGLGQLVEVEEPNSGTATVNVCPGTGEPTWVTSYGYDILGNLTSVTQNGSHNRSFTYDSLSRLLTSSNPEVGTLTYTYDANSNVATKKDARNITITYGYDVENREKSATYSNGDPSVATNYDETGCLGLAACQNVHHKTSMTDAAGAEVWSYQIDAANSRSAHRNQRTTSGITKTSTYYLNQAGDLYQIIYPTGRTVNYAYDNANRPKTAIDGSNSFTYATGFQTPPTSTACVAIAVCYTPQGTPYAISIGQTSWFTGLNVTEIFNSRLQPNQIKASSTGGNAMDITYSYTDPVAGGNAGHVFSIANNLNTSRSQVFAYDQLNRIKTAGTIATTGSYCWGYDYTNSYDAWGNLQSQPAGSAYTGCSQYLPPAMTANTSNRLSGFSYDASGNTLGDGVNSYTWNAESQLKTGGGVTYTYDGEGRRASKVGSKLYWYGSGGEILAETDTAGNRLTDYVFFAGRRVAALQPGTPNPGFESGATGWAFAGATLVTNAANAHSGSNYTQVSAPSGGSAAVSSSVRIRVQPGQVISSFGGWVYPESGASTHWGWTLGITNSSGTLISATSLNNGLPIGSWTQQTGTNFTVPANSAYAYMYCQVYLPTASTVLRCDDAFLTLDNVTYYAEDSLGSSRVVTDSSGVVCYDADFYPYGGERTYVNSCPPAYKFEGKERDAETGNDDFGARYYTNRFGRWLSSDWSAVPVAVPYANLSNPQTLNLYSMVSDDPESFADLDGHCTNGVIDPCPQGQSQNAQTLQQQQQLSAADVTKIVQQAQKSSSDPATTAINIFNGLGNNVSVTGDALRQGIKDSKVSLDDTSNALLANATSLAKNGSQVTISSARQTETNVGGVDVRVAATVKFTVGSEKGNPTLSGISGLGAKKGIWLDVQKVSVRPYNSGKAVFIQAGKGIVHATVPIPLPE